MFGVESCLALLCLFCDLMRLRFGWFVKMCVCLIYFGCVLFLDCGLLVIDAGLMLLWELFLWWFLV